MTTLLTQLGMKSLLSCLASFVIWFALPLSYLAARLTSQINHPAALLITKSGRLAARLIAEAYRLTFSVFASLCFARFFLSTQSLLKSKMLNAPEPSIEQVSTLPLYGKGLGGLTLGPGFNGLTTAPQKHRVFNRAAFYAVVAPILYSFGESVSGSAARLKTLCSFAPRVVCEISYTTRG